MTLDTSRVNMDPGLTPAQGRVVFHQERLLRSCGEDRRISAEYRQRCAMDKLPTAIDKMTVEQCKLALRNLEDACISYRLNRFRNVRTQWESL